MKRKNNGNNVRTPKISKTGGDKFIGTPANIIGKRRIDE